MTIRSVALVGALLVLAGCGTVSGSDPGARDEPTPTPTPTRTVQPVPAAIPDSPDLVRSRGMPTIISTGDGPPRLCLGAVAASLPPQCDGPVVVGWIWTKQAGSYQEAAGVRWGSYQVSGRMEGEKFAIRHAWVNNKYGMTGGGSRPAPRTACPEPAGGWRPVDGGTADDASLAAALAAAEDLPGYAGAWTAVERNPALGDGASARITVLTVRVAEDLDGAEAAIRETWSGALCVSEAPYSQADLTQIQQQVAELPGMLGSSVNGEQVEVEVVYDDGTLQAWADASYGPDVVDISAALIRETD